MYRRVACVFLLLALALVAEGKFDHECENSNSSLAVVNSLVVSGCDDTKTTCVLKRNNNVTITVEFVPSEDITSATTVVHGIIAKLPVPFPMPNPNACESAGLACPLQKGQTYTYTATLAVLKTYPKVRVDVKWEVQDQQNRDIFCLLINAKIQ